MKKKPDGTLSRGTGCFSMAFSLWDNSIKMEEKVKILQAESGGKGCKTDKNIIRCTVRNCAGRHSGNKESQKI